jgi:ribosomal protein S27AE
MLVIFGLSRKERQLAVVALACGRCGSPGQALVRRSTRLTLFFVPVLPLRTRRDLRCGRCGASRRLSRTEARQVTAAAGV